MKTDIDVMMLFKFEVKYVELNFKAIALMEFSFDNNSIYHVHMVVIYSWKSLKTHSDFPFKN